MELTPVPWEAQAIDALQRGDVEESRSHHGHLAYGARSHTLSQRHVDAVHAAFTHPDARLRQVAAWAMDQHRHLDAAPSFVVLLSDTDVEVRWAAAWGLVHLGKSVVKLVGHVACESPSADARAWARRVLQWIDGGHASERPTPDVDALTAALSEPWFRDVALDHRSRVLSNEVFARFTFCDLLNCLSAVLMLSDDTRTPPGDGDPLVARHYDAVRTSARRIANRIRPFYGDVRWRSGDAPRSKAEIDAILLPILHGCLDDLETLNACAAALKCHTFAAHEKLFDTLDFIDILGTFSTRITAYCRAVLVALTEWAVDAPA